MSAIHDPIREGLARGWKVAGGKHGDAPAKIVCDVAIVGSGAGGGVTAELLAKAGLQVVIVEEGVRNELVQFTVVDPPTQRPWRMLIALSSVFRAALSWYSDG